MIATAPMTDGQKLDLLLAKIELVLAEVHEVAGVGKTGITQAQFAKLLKKHPRTISRWVKDKKLRLEKDLVPHSEVKKFLS